MKMNEMDQKETSKMNEKWIEIAQNEWNYQK